MQNERTNFDRVVLDKTHLGLRAFSHWSADAIAPFFMPRQVRHICHDAESLRTGAENLRKAIRTIGS
jgi:hypothetical protein